MLLSPKTKLTKAKLGGKQFQFNPDAFQDSIAVNYNQITAAGMSYPLLAYSGGAAREIRFTIYLCDRFEKNITKNFIAHLHNFIPKANAKGTTQFAAPKKIRFAFGWFVKDCYLTGMNINYKDFSPTLQPWEAEVDLTLSIPQ